MFRRIADTIIHLWELLCHGAAALTRDFRTARPREKIILWCGMLFAVSLVGLTIYFTHPLPIEEGTGFWMEPPPKPRVVDYTKPARDVPPPFKAGQKRPARREGTVSHSIRNVPFNPETDLIRIEDDRVWWESEHDSGDTEDDHIFHYAMLDPMKRIIELVSARGATLKVQDAYRDAGIHASQSLHKQGRAVDLTADGMDLGQLSSLAWAAGFDWVYFEAPKKGGWHVHASVTPTNSPR